MKYGLLMGLVVGCTKPNPNYHPDGGPSDGTVVADDVATPLVDAKPACRHELLVQRGGFFDQPQIIVVDVDTFEERMISNGTDLDFSGEWSPDGSRIAFSRNAKSIWITDADGHGAQLLADPSNFLLQPAWSHDGTRVAYSSGDPSGSSGAIYSAAVAGSTGVNLTAGVLADPPIAWSPDDKTLLFDGVVGSDVDVYAAQTNAGGSHDLTNRPGKDGTNSVGWIDSATILFDASHIWTMTSSGTSLTNLTGMTHTESQPVWSATSSRIYYVEDGNDLYAMNRTGTDQHLVSTGSLNTEPQVSPDGTKLAFTSGRDGNGDTNIYISGANGETPTRVTNSGKDFHPRWRPCN